MKADALTALVAAGQARRPLARIVRLADGQDWTVDQTPPAGLEPLAPALAEALRTGKAVRAEVQGALYLIDALLPAPRLILVGAVHIARALAPMADGLGHRVTIVDPRGGFVHSGTFGPARLIEDWPDDYLAQDPPDGRTALVTLTHDPKLDDAALLPALASPAYYLGCLGSRKTHAARLDRLRAKGLPEEALDRLHGPVGLAIGAATAEEIALAILAQIVQVLRQ